jgi:hypothetical protein
VDTGFNAYIVLPSAKLIRPIVSPPQAKLLSGMGLEMPTNVIEQRIVFAGMSRTSPCGVQDRDYAVVGMLFLEEFQQTLLTYRTLANGPVAVLLDNQTMFRLLRSVPDGPNEA